MARARHHEIKNALADWQQAAETAMRAGHSAAVPSPSSDLPGHIRAFLDEALAKASSLYWVRDVFAQALELAKYPPGFVAPHPAYLAYRGAGIAADKHVQSHLFNFACPVCGSTKDAVVLTSEWGVNLNNGDARGRFTARCARCDNPFSGGFED
ncbi:MAG: hypothetical protein KDI56_16150 [Xanthomonadales bacterium]|nr:hypothetical protein [Xanthomonadales bacterium]